MLDAFTHRFQQGLSFPHSICIASHQLASVATTLRRRLTMEGCNGVALLFPKRV